MSTAAFRLWAKHLLCFVFPGMTLAFVLTGPHRWWVALCWLIPLPVFDWLDRRSNTARHEPLAAPTWPFDLILFGLAALQILNVLLLARMFPSQSMWSTDALMALIVVGSNSGLSGIVVAHELIHRKEQRFRWLGRAVLCTVLYEHFYTEHVRGHHVRVGTLDDPATARFGETFVQLG